MHGSITEKLAVLALALQFVPQLVFTGEPRIPLMRRGEWETEFHSPQKSRLCRALQLQFRQASFVLQMQPKK